MNALSITGLYGKNKLRILAGAKEEVNKTSHRFLRERTSVIVSPNKLSSSQLATKKARSSHGQNMEKSQRHYTFTFPTIIQCQHSCVARTE